MQKRQRRVVIAPRSARLEYSLTARMNVSKDSRWGYGGLQRKGATEANVGSIHLMSMAEGPEPRPALVAALTLLRVQAPSLLTLLILWFHTHYFFFFFCLKGSAGYRMLTSCPFGIYISYFK